MTYRQITECLADAGIEQAGTEAALLLSHFFGVSHAQLLAAPEKDFQSEPFFAALDKRCEHYPLQYVLGEWYFFNETYYVDPSCLIPRSDTEILVEQAISSLPQGAFFADLCTGSGCIAISTLAHRSDCTALAVDLFEETLAIAKKNAVRNGVDTRLDFLKADVLDANTFDGDLQWDAILSNPPYIRSAVVDTLEQELFSEPRAALDGGADGLCFYRAILAHHAKHLKKDGFILFEIGFDQKEDIEALAAQYGYRCQIGFDLSGNPRTAKLKKDE
jgi:release factor glutamine methyltransferase